MLQIGSNRLSPMDLVNRLVEKRGGRRARRSVLHSSAHSYIVVKERPVGSYELSRSSMQGGSSHGIEWSSSRSALVSDERKLVNFMTLTRDGIERPRCTFRFPLSS